MQHIPPNGRIMTRAACTSFCRINQISRPNTSIRFSKAAKPLKSNPSKAIFTQRWGKRTRLCRRWPGPSSANQTSVWPEHFPDPSPVHNHSSFPFWQSQQYYRPCPASPPLCLCLSKVCQGRTHDLMPHSDANANVCCKGTGGANASGCHKACH